MEKEAMTELEVMQLRIQEVPRGDLKTNVAALEAFVSEKLSGYDPANYTGDVKTAKAARAELNKSRDYVKMGRRQLEEKMREPFVTVLDRLKKVEGNIQLASGNIDSIIKAKEAAEKEKKHVAIKAYWNATGFSLFDLDRVFDNVWLNKTFKFAKVKEEIDKKQAEVYAELQLLEKFPEDVDTLKAMYLETLDISLTIQKADQLKANKEKAKKEQESRAGREMADQQSELTREEVRTERFAATEDLASAALGEESDDDPEMTYTLTFTAKKSVLFALRQYMTDNGIKYVKEVTK